MNKTNTRRSPKADEREAPYHHGDLRDALVEAAQRILETDGLVALSLRAVARRAGVSPAAPYHHFPDKQRRTGKCPGWRRGEPSGVTNSLPRASLESCW